MAFRLGGNVPLYSTTAATVTDPSTASLIAELIIPASISTSGAPPSYYEVRYAVGASTGGAWRLECALSSGLGSSAIRTTENDSTSALQRTIVFTGSNQTAEYVFTHKAYPGDRFRIVPLSSLTATAAGSIQIEGIS